MRQWIVHIILCVLVLCGMSNVAQAQCVPSHLPYYANDQLRNFNFPSCWFVHCDYGSWGISYTPGSDIYSFDMSCDTTIDGYGLVVFDTIAESLDGKYLVYDAMCSSSGGVVFDVGLCTSVSPVVFTEVCRDTVTTASGGRGVSRLSGEGRLALRITQNRADAEDVVQETMMKVWNRRGEWQQIENMEAFCLTVCRNISLDKLRRMDRQVLSLEDTPPEAGGYDPIDHSHSANPEQQAVQRDRLQQVRRIISQLPEKQRSCMQLRDIEGKSYRDIATILGITEQQVKVNIFRARQTVKEKMMSVE